MRNAGMKKKIISCGLVIALVACTMIGGRNESNENVLDNGSPWINSDLKENIHPEQPTSPKDDFHLYASMDWLSKAELPDGNSRYSRYDECAENTTKKAIKLFNEGDFTGASHNVQLAKQLYDLYKDTEARNKEGVEPIREMTERFLNVQNLDDINAIVTDEYVAMVCPALIQTSIGGGIEDTTTNLCWVDIPTSYSGGNSDVIRFILNDAAEYTNRTEYGDMIFNYKKDVFVYIMGRLGMDEAEANERFDAAIAFETLFAKDSFTAEDAMSADYYDRVNNTFNYDELIAFYKNYPMAGMLDAIGLRYDGPYMISDLEGTKALDAAYTEENAKNIANYMLVNYVLGRKNYLDEDIRLYSVQCINRYYGTSGDLPLDERAYNWITDNLPEQTTQAYVEHYSSEADKEKIENICYQAIEVYKEMLAENDWISEATKEAAIDKLEAIKVSVGWPDRWNDYSELDISNDSFAKATEKITYYKKVKKNAELGKIIDKTDWAKGEDLLQCNAYYDFTQNMMVLMIGMMGEPFYWSDMSTEELYASLGAFWIGHELSHAFDSNGSQWDKNGNYSDWWAENDKAEFNRRVDSFIEYLNTIRIMGDYYVNGSNIDSEIVADTIGLKCALKMAEKEKDFDYKAFFEFFSDMNSGINLYSYQISTIQNDPHPLDYIRVNVPVQQFEKFYETYDIREGDNMYLAPEKRLNLW